MARGKKKTEKAALNALKRRIMEIVARDCPGCEVVFVGQQSRAALVGRTLGYRLRDRATGRYRTNIEWIK
jgi:hypothetical protein